MQPHSITDSILAAAALASTILLLGATYLLILRTPNFQFSLRFLLFSIGGIAVCIGLWTALLRTTAPGMAEPAGPAEPDPANPNSPPKPQQVVPTDQLTP